jgi:metal iron transporter
LNHNTERATRLAGQDTQGTVSLANNWATMIGAWIIWLIIAFMNVATLAFLGMGIGDN